MCFSNHATCKKVWHKSYTLGPCLMCCPRTSFLSSKLPGIEPDSVTRVYGSLPTTLTCKQKFQMKDCHLYQFMRPCSSAEYWISHSMWLKFHQALQQISGRWIFRISLQIQHTYASEPQQRVWDFCFSLLDLSELRRALNFLSQAGHL